MTSVLFFPPPSLNAQLPIIFPSSFVWFSGKYNIFYFLHPSPDVSIPGVVYRETIINKTLLPFLLQAFSLKVKVGDGMANGINSDFGRINWEWSAWPIALYFFLKSWLATVVMKAIPGAQYYEALSYTEKTKTTYSQY